MKITSSEEYGLRCLMLLAARDGDRPLTIPEISEMEGLSLPHVGKIMGILRDSGLVESVRGRSGGYILKYPPEELTLSRIFRSLEGRLLNLDFCSKEGRKSENCVHIRDCSIQSFWEAFVLIMDRFLGEVTLADLGSKRIAASYSPRSLLDRKRRGPVKRAKADRGVRGRTVSTGKEAPKVREGER
jgi:Rrf2 family protein